MTLVSGMLAVIANAGEARAACVVGTEGECFVNGQHGTRVCVGGGANGGWGRCRLDPPPTTMHEGKIVPRYHVLTVVYAPPGTQGGRSASSVTYGSGSTTGSAVSTSSSFKSNVGVTATATAKVGGNGGVVEVSFEQSKLNGDTSTLELKKTTATEISVPGPSVDGIDHDRDLIYLWINPTVSLRLTRTGTKRSADWSFEGGGRIQYVYVGWLKNPTTLPVPVRTELERAGITPSDYPSILSVDPYAAGTPVMDDTRYVSLGTSIPYEPPFSATDPTPVLRLTVTGTDTSTTEAVLEEETAFGLSATVSVGFSEELSASLKLAGKFTWKNTSKRSDSTATTQSAMLAIAGPSFGYTGPTYMDVYLDRIYKTFLFVPGAPARLAFEGRVTRSGKPVACKEVTVVARGTSYRTFTNLKGQFRIYEKMSGPVEVQVDGVKRSIAPAASAKQIAVELP